jgi:hypothetical protein
LAEESIRKL